MELFSLVPKEWPLLCTLPGRRPGTAEGGERARPGRVLVFYVHFYQHIWQYSPRVGNDPRKNELFFSTLKKKCVIFFGVELFLKSGGICSTVTLIFHYINWIGFQSIY